MTDKTFLKMTDREIEVAFRRTAIGCQYSNDPKAAFKRLVKENFDCQYNVAIIFSQSNGAGQRMWSGMVCSPSTSKTINF